MNKFVEEEIVEFDFDQHKQPVSVAELNKACEDMFKLKTIIEEKDEELSILNKQLEELKQKVLGFLSENNLEDEGYKSPYGAISVRHIESVRVEDKSKLVSFLIESGAQDMLSIHNKTLQGWYREQKEKAEDKLNFSLPGISEPKIFTTIAMIKPKK